MNGATSTHPIAIAILLLLTLPRICCGRMPDEMQREQEFCGAYFGQPPPGRVPTVFAPGIISKPVYHEHSSPAFSHDGREVYWSAQCLYEGSPNHRIFFSRMDSSDCWTTPEVVWFTRGQHGGCPVFSPDERRLYFHSCRPRPFHERFDNMAIWYAERAGTEWGEPVKLDAPINSDHSDGSPYLLADGTLYFSSNRPGGNGEQDIYRSKFVDGRFVAPEHLGDGINTEHSEYSPCVARDESYIVFSRYVEQPKGVQLHVSFSRPDGSWTSAVPMGEKIELCRRARIPGLSPDGEYLFFCGYADQDVEVYWVSAEVLEAHREDQE